jgi:hypothetical protein
LSNGNDKWRVDARIVYPILILTAISLVLVVFTKNDQLNLLDRILDVEHNMTSALNQSVSNYMHIRDNLRDVRDFGCVVRVLADADENIHLVMRQIGIPANSTDDKIHVSINVTHIVYSEAGKNVTYKIPEIRNCQ